MSIRISRSYLNILFVLLALAAFIFLGLRSGGSAVVDEEQPAKVKRKTTGPQASVIAAPVPKKGPNAPPTPPSGFSPQIKFGFDVGDQWEPAIAVDRSGHVYAMFNQYYGVPGCDTCASPTMLIQTSNDHGQTWSAPRVLYPAGATTGGQWDPQISVDPVDGRTVYAAWLQNNKSDIVVGKSTDYGATWSVVVADDSNAAQDKPIMAVRGQDVYVVYNHAQKIWAASSHDGGQTFTQTQINVNGKLGWALPGGGTVTPNGHVFFAWAGYEQNGGARGKVNLFVSKSVDGGATWLNNVREVSRAPEKCPADYLCGWAYLGAQMVMTSDNTGVVYVMWNSNSVDFAPGRVYFSKSTDDGVNWSAKVDVSTASNGISHNFPAIAAVGNGDVRISWMDNRIPGWWNTYYRSSTNGGASWSAETDISSYVSGYSYITPDGFRFPFGDYYELDIDEQGTAHVVMGEGWSYDSPGSVWYTRGK